MGVTVHSRLGDLLRDRNVTVRDLQQRLATRFGLVVDVRTLDRLARADRVRRPNLELAAASADVLGVELGEIFAVATAPAHEDIAPGMNGYELADGEDDILDPAQSRRLQSLYDRQHRCSLTDAEWAEMHELVAEWGRRVRERGVRGIAAERGQPVDQVRAELDAELTRKIAWYRELQADPARLESLVQESQDQQHARAAQR